MSIKIANLRLVMYIRMAIPRKFGGIEHLNHGYMYYVANYDAHRFSV